MEHIPDLAVDRGEWRKLAALCAISTGGTKVSGRVIIIQLVFYLLWNKSSLTRSSLPAKNKKKTQDAVSVDAEGLSRSWFFPYSEFNMAANLATEL